MLRYLVDYVKTSSGVQECHVVKPNLELSFIYIYIYEGSENIQTGTPTSMHPHQSLKKSGYDLLLSDDECYVLNKGLHFIPLEKSFNQSTVRQHVDVFFTRL